MKQGFFTLIISSSWLKSDSASSLLPRGLMKKSWLLIILLLSLGLMLIHRSHEIQQLQSFIPMQKVHKLKHFAKVKTGLSHQDQDLLEIWESMLTGNTRPLNKVIKEDFSRLGLRHLFTPSGLHLTALLYPTLKIFRGQKMQVLILTLLAFIFFPLSGFVALKRMVCIKWLQKFVGYREGFIFALLLDLLFGSFQVHALSFTYSFLFLGIMYSGVKCLGRVFWFFIGQSIIAFSQGIFIAPLLIIFSPVISFLFVLVLPVLFLLSFPLWDWQLETGLSLLRILLKTVSLSAEISSFIPSWEMHSGMLMLIGFCVFRKSYSFLLTLIFMSSSLNLDLKRSPSPSSYEWIPQGQIQKIEERKDKTVIRYSDGKCETILVRGMWWKKCSPKRGSRKNLRKLSYPSLRPRRSSLRG
jgi:hypothetical protein